MQIKVEQSGTLLQVGEGRCGVEIDGTGRVRTIRDLSGDQQRAMASALYRRVRVTTVIETLDEAGAGCVYCGDSTCRESPPAAAKPVRAEDKDATQPAGSRERHMVTLHGLLDAAELVERPAEENVVALRWAIAELRERPAADDGAPPRDDGFRGIPSKSAVEVAPFGWRSADDWVSVAARYEIADGVIELGVYGRKAAESCKMPAADARALAHWLLTALGEREDVVHAVANLTRRLGEEVGAHRATTDAWRKATGCEAPTDAQGKIGILEKERDEARGLAEAWREFAAARSALASADGPDEWASSARRVDVAGLALRELGFDPAAGKRLDGADKATP